MNCLTGQFFCADLHWEISCQGSARVTHVPWFYLNFMKKVLLFQARIGKIVKINICLCNTGDRKDVMEC